jgi:hypothetical protein
MHWLVFAANENEGASKEKAWATLNYFVWIEMTYLDLDLVVNAPQDVNASIFLPSTEVPGAVHV